MKKIKVITGGIGSGKSYVCDMLRERGIDVYDCDFHAKRLMEENEAAIDGLKKLIGDNAYIGHKLNKPVIAQFLLDNANNAKAINSIVHPIVAKDFLQSDFAWLESAIYFETDFGRQILTDCTPNIICVSAPLEIRIARIMHRDSISRDRALEWIEKQMPDEENIEKSDFVIINDGKQNIDKQINDLLNGLS